MSTVRYLGIPKTL